MSESLGSSEVPERVEVDVELPPAPEFYRPFSALRNTPPSLYECAAGVITHMFGKAGEFLWFFTVNDFILPKPLIREITAYFQYYFIGHVVRAAIEESDMRRLPEEIANAIPTTTLIPYGLRPLNTFEDILNIFNGENEYIHPQEAFRLGDLADHLIQTSYGQHSRNTCYYTIIINGYTPVHGPKRYVCQNCYNYLKNEYSDYLWMSTRILQCTTKWLLLIRIAEVELNCRCCLSTIIGKIQTRATFFKYLETLENDIVDEYYDHRDDEKYKSIVINKLMLNLDPPLDYEIYETGFFN